MTKIYVPTEFLNKSCYQVNNDYIRVWDSNSANQYNNYSDIFINQDYQVRKGISQFYNNVQVCDNYNTYTDNVYYRVDFDRIVFLFIMFLFLCFYCPYRLIARILGKWGKL